MERNYSGASPRVAVLSDGGLSSLDIVSALCRTFVHRPLVMEATR